MRSQTIGVRFQLFRLQFRRLGSDSDGLLGLRAGAGSRPGGRVSFKSTRVAGCLCADKGALCARCSRTLLRSFLQHQKKPKERRPCWLRPSASLRATCGGALAGCAVELAARLRRSAQTATASQFTKHARTSAHATPQVLRRRRLQKGWGGQTAPTSTRAIAALGSACAARGACARDARPSAAMARTDVRLRVPFWPCREAQGAGRACAEGHTPSLTNSLRLFERSAPARSEFRSAPRERASQVAPRAARGRGQQGRLLFGDFLLATKRKLLRRRAHIPAPALNQLNLSKDIATNPIQTSARAQKHLKSASRGHP
jgi:hypothetical protein